MKIYTPSQFAEIKRNAPRCIFPKHCKDGTISYMVRVSTMMGDKKTLITTKDAEEAKQVLADYLNKRYELVPQTAEDTADITKILQEATITEEMNEYLTSMPPHEITGERTILAVREDGSYFSISPEVQTEYLRRLYPSQPSEASQSETQSETQSEQPQEEPMCDPFASVFGSGKSIEELMKEIGDVTGTQQQSQG